MLLNINFLNLSINNYAGLGGWGIKDFVCPHTKEITHFQGISTENKNDTEKGVHSRCA